MECKTCGDETGSDKRERCGSVQEKNSCRHIHSIRYQNDWQANRKSLREVREDPEVVKAAKSSGYF